MKLYLQSLDFFMTVYTKKLGDIKLYFLLTDFFITNMYRKL